VPLEAVVGAFVSFDGSTDQIIVTELRLPRTIVGLLVGVALGLAGAVMQGMTRNPLAEPGILGINAGAALAVALGIMAGVANVGGYVWFALAGAAVGSAVVYVLGAIGRGRPSVVRLALAGAVVAAMSSSATSAILILDAATLDRFRFWEAGSIAGSDYAVIGTILPLVVLGSVLAVGLGRALNAVALGDDLAQSLGQRIGLVRLVGSVSVVLLSGAAVAAAGPIYFVGLAVPHAARLIVGGDYRWILVYSLVLGPALVLGADVLGRMVARPAEVEVGIITALVGVPIFIALVRNMRQVEL
jgi:iron complex transport system permease protein